MKLKKLFKNVLSFSFVIAILCVNSAIPVNAKKIPSQVDPSTSQSFTAHGIYDFDNSSSSSVVKKNSSTENSILASNNNLIIAVQLTLTKNGTSLSVYGNTRSDYDMSKIGFNNITIQREVNGTWQNYTEWTNLYDYNTISYFNDLTINVPSGYYYRAIANHYAEKSTFLWFKDTQTYYNQTTALYV